MKNEKGGGYKIVGFFQGIPDVHPNARFAKYSEYLAEVEKHPKGERR